MSDNKEQLRPRNGNYVTYADCDGVPPVASNAVRVGHRNTDLVVNGQSYVGTTETTVQYTDTMIKYIPTALRRVAKWSMITRRDENGHISTVRPEILFDIRTKCVFVPVPPTVVPVPPFKVDPRINQKPPFTDHNPFMPSRVGRTSHSIQGGNIALRHMALVVTDRDRRQGCFGIINCSIIPALAELDPPVPDKLLLIGLCVPEPLLDPTGQVPRIWFSDWDRWRLKVNLMRRTGNGSNTDGFLQKIEFGERALVRWPAKSHL